MTILYIILILLQIGVIVYFVRRGRMLRKKAAEQSLSSDATSYEGLRNLALRITPAQLTILIPETQTVVYGVVMDVNLGDGIVTLTAYITGAANIYFSKGDSKIGGGKIPEVAEATVDFISLAQGYVGRSIQVTTFELPANGCVRFYLLSNHGMYAAQEQLSHIQDGTSPWIKLFECGNEVMALMHNIGNGSLSH